MDEITHALSHDPLIYFLGTIIIGLFGYGLAFCLQCLIALIFCFMCSIIDWVRQKINHGQRTTHS